MKKPLKDGVRRIYRIEYERATLTILIDRHKISRKVYVAEASV
ncbi:MAG: hypothetical protein QXN08_07270 [Nitrososphaerales archaeon]